MISDQFGLVPAERMRVIRFVASNPMPITVPFEIN